jgi:hypothetical protein
MQTMSGQLLLPPSKKVKQSTAINKQHMTLHHPRLKGGGPQNTNKHQNIINLTNATEASIVHSEWAGTQIGPLLKL